MWQILTFGESRSSLYYSYNSCIFEKKNDSTWMQICNSRHCGLILLSLVFERNNVKRFLILDS